MQGFCASWMTALVIEDLVSESRRRIWHKDHLGWICRVVEHFGSYAALGTNSFLRALEWEENSGFTIGA